MQIVNSHKWREIKFYELTYMYIIFQCDVCKLIRKEILTDPELDIVYLLEYKPIEYLNCNEVIMKGVLE